MEVDRDPCQDVSSIKRSLKSTATSQRLTRRASLLSIPHLPQVSALSLPNQTRAVQRTGSFFLSFFCIFLTLVYGLLNRSLPLLAWTAASAMTPPPLYLTGVGRLLVCSSLSSSPLLERPAGDLTHSLYWDHMNNLFFEFSPILTFRCLMPTGSGFNNIDSAPLLCASSDKVWKRSQCTWYQNRGYRGSCRMFHALHSSILLTLRAVSLHVQLDFI